MAQEAPELGDQNVVVLDQTDDADGLEHCQDDDNEAVGALKVVQPIS